MTRYMLSRMILAFFFIEGFARMERCSQPPEVGECRARLPRFYYDTALGKCRRFHYGGCGGNENNFGTLEECNSSCVVSVERDRVSPVEAPKLSRRRSDFRSKPKRHTSSSIPSNKLV